MKKAEKTAAVLTINNAPAMTVAGRRNIAAWLRRHASMLIKEGKNYNKGRFTGRYIYT